MNRTFVTSDTHFGHVNIIRYCSRPFVDVNEMNDGMIARWNNIVASDDVVYHLGDFAFIREPAILKRVIFDLNGTINLVPGNHDKPMRKLWNDPFMKPCGFTMMDPITNIEVEGRLFVLSHFPMEEWENKKYESVHLHGHSHGKPLQSQARNRYDVGVDVYGGPVEITANCEFLQQPKGWTI